MATTWTDEQLRKAIANNVSIAGVLNELGLKAAGGNYATVKSFISENDVDTSHFKGQSWSKGIARGPSRPIEYYLIDGSKVGSDTLRRRLIKEGLFEAKCYSCDRNEWMGKQIPLELEHINGVHRDNRIENLTILCPNCHAQTPTYRGKNIRSRSPTGRDTKLKISEV